jgi:hypothetical protein
VAVAVVETEAVMFQMEVQDYLPQVVVAVVLQLQQATAVQAL